jgi:pimeloyl-ACP methyl ester carboxylesterase
LSKQAVVLVHGLWLNGLDMSLLRRRLNQDFQTYQFSYNSVKLSPSENADKLKEFLTDIDASTIHFVGHSLGGLVIRYLFHHYPQQKPGRIVTLGTPHKYSHSAKQVSRFPAGKFFLGESIEQGLLGEMPNWSGSTELGSIAGTLRFGLDIMAVPNDGTVAVDETRLEGMSDHMTLPVSHFGLLLSTQAHTATLNFLREGKF